MRMLQLGFLTTAFLALTACSQEEAAPPAFEEPVATPIEEPITLPAETRASLQSIADSGVTGEIVARPTQDRTEITLTVAGAPANESVGARILSGTCESPGVEVADLSAISTDGMGQGQSVTDVGHTASQILNGNHVAAVYAPGTDPGQDAPIACATLPTANM